MKKIIILFIIFCCMSFKVYALEDVQKVSLGEAINIALENNVDLRSAKINIDIAMNEIFVANKLKNPSLDVFYFLGGAGNNEPRQIGISQKIEIAKRNARKNLAKSQYKLVEKNLDYTTFDLKMDVREAYINLVAAKSILDTLKQQEVLQEELLRIAKYREKTYQAPEIDAIQAEIALNQIIAQVNSANVNVKNALSLFNKVINNPEKVSYDSVDTLFLEENNFEEMQTPSPNTKFPKIDIFIEDALKNRFDVQIAKQEIDVAKKNLILTTRQKVPNLQITGGYAYLPGRYTGSGNFNSGAYAGVSLEELPLFYNYSKEIQNAAYKLEQAKLNYISVKNKSIKDITSAYDKFITAAENLNHYESKIIISSAKLIESSKKSYEAGHSDITSLIVMKQSYKSIIIGYAQALADYYNGWTNFLREVNDENFDMGEFL